MNCYNIREIQSILRNKHFVDLLNTADHRDFVLSNAQRSDTIILCQSRARDPDGILTIDL